MRHVLEKLNYANRSMKHKLVIYMAAMGLLLAAVLLVSLQILGRINTPGEELSKSMSIQMEVFRSDMASLWRNVSGMSTHLSKDMTDILEDTLAEQGMTFSELDGNLDAISQVEEALLEPLCQYARQTDCSGAFVILEAAIGVSSGEADRSGLYVQRSNAEHLTGDLLLYRGMAEIGKAHGVMPHRKWSREFNTETLPDYRQCLADAAVPVSSASCRTSALITLPGTSERAVLLTIPMVGEDGTVYGLCGFGVNQTYFAAHHKQPTGFQSVACLMASEGGVSNTLDSGGCLMTGGAGDYCYVPINDRLTLKPMRHGMTSMKCGDLSYVGMTMDFTAVGGDSESRTLAVLIPAQDYRQLVVRSVWQTALLLFLLLFALCLACIVLSRRYLSPLLRDLRQLTEENRGDGQMSYSEFAAVSGSLRAQDEAHQETVFALESEKDAALRQSESLLGEKAVLQAQVEETQSRLETVQTDASRMAHAQKDDIDPEVYRIFVTGLDKLTNTERKIYEGYVVGMGPQEMSVQFSVKVSTIYSHTKSILRKTGLDSYRKVQQYAAILRQTQEEQENET